jgi:tRNA-Thr(GGU) m(6)t(6)A37 methyltransferase TsaA
MCDSGHGVRVEPVGIIHSCFTEKFGIPRQPGLVRSAVATLELLQPYNREEMVRGLEGFSHIWLQFLFHQTVGEGWKATVRPPTLGGKKRVGVFSTRSPHRPNHLGLSVVRLERVRATPGKPVLELSGIDLLDGTPVFDIKPYIPYSDRVDAATIGYADGKLSAVEVVLAEQPRLFCAVYRSETGRDLEKLIVEVVRHDPRPASQRGCRAKFGMALWDVNVRWRVGTDGCCIVEQCERFDR